MDTNQEQNKNNNNQQSIVVDLQNQNQSELILQIRQACSQHGFFYIKNFGIDEKEIQNLFSMADKFLKLSLDEKNEISMDKGGKAWRGYFGPGGELTKGRADHKEGYYFGREVTEENINQPLLGKNLFPKQIPEFKDTILNHMKKMEEIAAHIMQLIAISLLGEANKNYFKERYTADPTVLFRIFNYIPSQSKVAPDGEFGCGEHTDYGFLTLLIQDNQGGLQVKSIQTGEWIDVAFIPGTIIINIGDMLEFWTKGLYKAILHRVVKKMNGRISFPFFYDPGWNAELEPIKDDLFLTEIRELQKQQMKRYEGRWDGFKNLSKEAFIEKGYNFNVYGDYLWFKVSQVFPKLAEKVMNLKDGEIQQNDNCGC